MTDHRAKKRLLRRNSALSIKVPKAVIRMNRKEEAKFAEMFGSSTPSAPVMLNEPARVDEIVPKCVIRINRKGKKEKNKFKKLFGSSSPPPPVTSEALRVDKIVPKRVIRKNRKEEVKFIKLFGSSSPPPPVLREAMEVDRTENSDDRKTPRSSSNDKSLISKLKFVSDSKDNSCGDYKSLVSELQIDSDDEGDDLVIDIDTTKENSEIEEIKAIKSQLMHEKPCPKSRKRNMLLVGDKNKSKKNNICQEPESLDLKNGAKTEIKILSEFDNNDTMDIILNVEVNTKSVSDVTCVHTNHANSINVAYGEQTNKTLFENKNATNIVSKFTLQNIDHVINREKNSNAIKIKKLDDGQTPHDKKIAVENYSKTNEKELQKKSFSLTESIMVKTEDNSITVKQEISDIITTNNSTNDYVEVKKIKEEPLTSILTDSGPDSSNTMLLRNNIHECNRIRFKPIETLTEQTDTVQQHNDMVSNWAAYQNSMSPQEISEELRIMQTLYPNLTSELRNSYPKPRSVTPVENSIHPLPTQNPITPEHEVFRHNPIETYIYSIDECQMPYSVPHHRNQHQTEPSEHQKNLYQNQSTFYQEPEWLNKGEFADSSPIIGTPYNTTMLNNESIPAQKTATDNSLVNQNYYTNTNGIMYGGQHVRNPFPPKKSPYTAATSTLPEDLRSNSTDSGFASPNSTHLKNPSIKNFQNQFEMYSQKQNTIHNLTAHQTSHVPSYDMSMITPNTNVPLSVQAISKKLDSQIPHQNPNVLLQNNNKKIQNLALSNRPPPPPYSNILLQNDNPKVNMSLPNRPLPPQYSHFAAENEAFRQNHMVSLNDDMSTHQYTNLPNPISQYKNIPPQPQYVENLKKKFRNHSSNHQPHWPNNGNYYLSAGNNLAATSDNLPLLSNTTMFNNQTILTTETATNNSSIDKSFHIRNQDGIYGRQYVRNGPVAPRRQFMNPHSQNMPLVTRNESYLEQHIRFPLGVNRANSRKHIGNQDEMHSVQHARNASLDLGEQFMTSISSDAQNMPVLSGNEQYVGQQVRYQSIAYQANRKKPMTAAASAMPEDLRSTSRDSGFMSPTNTVTSPTAPAGRCKMCNTPTILKCLGCCSVFYCSQSCQMVDWSSHQLLCSNINYRTGQV